MEVEIQEPEIERIKAYPKIVINEKKLSKEVNKELQDSVIKYDDIVSKHEYDVESTWVIEYEIPLTVDTPIKLRTRIMPNKLQAEAEKQIKHMENNGIIQRS